MSLRNDIHEAFDDVAPAGAGVTDRVILAVTSGRSTRTSRTLRLRAPLSLVAALLAIALVVGALMGGRLLADWRAFATPHQVTQLTPLQKLEARPFRLHTVRSNAECQDGPYDANGNVGLGALHTSGSSVETRTSWGSYFHDVLFADGPVSGPILMRGEDLMTGMPIVIVGQYAAGRAIGPDVLDGQPVEQHTELVIDPAASPWAWQFIAGMARTTDCEGWQIDTPGSSESFSFVAS